MPKMKTRKTLAKRVKLTRNGKFVKKHVQTGHLKVKWSADARHEKAKTNVIQAKGFIKMFRKMLP